jgi:predicted esterase
MTEPRRVALRTERHGRCFELGPTRSESLSELWLVLHGYGQRADRFLRHFAAHASANRLFVAPEGLSRFYLDEKFERIGASWMTRLDREEEILDTHAWLDRVLLEVRSRHPRIDHVGVFGFSQGGLTASRWLCSGGGPADRLVTWGCGLAHDIDLVACRDRIEALAPLSVLGDQDEYVDEAMIEAEQRRLAEAGVRIRLLRYEGGHRIRSDVLARVLE